MLSPPGSVAMDTGLNRDQAPMDGMVLCCTSISPEKRTDLANMAAQMGAIHKFDLTSDVTHLIVGDTDTPKYKFVAKERPDVKCLLPAWVEALRDLWTADVEPDMQELETRYRLPTLHNLRICVTGFEDMVYRKKLEDDVNNNGGEYRGNLTKDVTHLIAKEPSGAKHKYAIDWKIKIVGVEWLEQSLERGLILDEQLYSLALPPADRGRNAWIRRVVSSSSLGKRSFDGDLAPNGPRKLRRTASAKLNSQNVGFWTDIVNGDVKKEEQKHNQWSEEALKDESSRATKAAGTLTERFDSHANSSTPIVTPAAPPFGAPHARLLDKTGIFAGRRICLHGFNEKKTSILHKHLLSHNAEILPDHSSFTPAATSSPKNEYLLIPYDLSTHSIPTIPTNRHRPVVVTDMWAERCLHRKKYIAPEENTTNTPFRRFPILGFERLVVCSTRFEDVDLLHMSKAVKLMGATYEEDFSPKASVLVCNKVVLGHEKLRHAQHWHVPAVTADWLWDCIRCGEMKSFEPYLAQPYSAERPPGEKESQKQPLGRTGSNAKFGQRPIGEQAQGNDSLNKRMGGLDGRGLDPTKGTTTMQNEPDNTNANDLNHLGQPTTHASLPLQKITPNSSPPKPSISSKPTTTTDTDPPAPLKHPCQDPALSSAISSLLTHHQNARSLASSKPTIATTQNPPPPRLRRKRQLLGRAPSNASNLSRASSVDTVNTDGVGTPVELTRSASMISNKTNSIKNNATTTLAAAAADDDNSTFDPLATYRDEDDAALMESHDHLQMTQLGYEDPDALAWREKVEQKLGSITRKKNDDEGRGRRVKDIGRVKDLTGKGAVGTRTRQAQATGR